MKVRMRWTFWRVVVVGILAVLLGRVGLRRLRTQMTGLATMARAAAKTAVLLLKVYPMLPSRPLDWVTPRPVVERFRYPTSHGPAEGDLYRPITHGPLSWFAWASSRSVSTIHRCRASGRPSPDQGSRHCSIGRPRCATSAWTLWMSRISPLPTNTCSHGLCA
jgi:hypothetical protein